MTTPAILAYVREPGSVFTGTLNAAFTDYANNLVYTTFQGGTNAGDGFAKFNGYTDDTDLLERTVSALSPVTSVQTTFDIGAFIPSGYIVFEGNGSGGGLSALFSIRASDLSYTARYDNILALYNIVPLTSAGTNYVITTENPVVAHAIVSYAPAPSLTTYTTLFTIDEKTAVAGRGASGSTGTAFVLGKPAATTDAFGLYKISSVSGAAPTHTKLGTVTPAQIDATWTHCTSSAGVAYDQTDGNVICMFETTDVVTNKHYIAKLSAVDASVVWALAISSNIDTDGDFYLSRANITASTFYYLHNGTLHTVNTSAGTEATATIGTLTQVGGQISDDASTSLLVRGTWSETTTTPTYLGTYMGDGGNHAIASQCWLRFFPAGAPVPPVPPPPAPPFPIVSVNRAWTYTMDGHTFYVLDLGAEGTFAYDLDSKEWSNFQTNGSNWSMVNGCMFGDRVVAGDLATTDVWELVPSAGKDSGSYAYEIDHVVTGGLTQRSRTYLSVASFRVTASFGQLDDPAGVTFTLQYSDDQGQTWTTPDTIALAESDFTSEIVWRSLGSFAAPGRIFQLSDSGGLIRIDGADAAIENFDEDDEPQKQT